MKNKNELLIFCNNIRLLREAYDISKKEMSKIIGISERSLSLLEDGVIPKISVEVIFKTARYFGVQPTVLFQEDKIKTFTKSDVFRERIMNK